MNDDSYRALVGLGPKAEGRVGMPTSLPNTSARRSAAWRGSPALSPSRFQRKLQRKSLSNLWGYRQKYQ